MAASEVRGLRIDVNLILKIVQALANIFMEQQERGNATPRAVKKYKTLEARFMKRAEKQAARYNKGVEKDDGVDPVPTKKRRSTKARRKARGARAKGAPARKGR